MPFRLARLLAGFVFASAASVAWATDQPAAAVLRFEIKRFEIAGNTLLPEAEVNAVVAPFTGKDRDFGDIQRARQALEAAYHAYGYKMTTVKLPEQELNQGVVKLNVAQTRIGRVIVSGNTVFDEANIRRSMPSLQPGQTPNLNRVSANLRQANENPAKKIQIKLASAQADGEVDARLDVTDENAWKAVVNLDNSGSDSTGRTHAGVVLQNANMFGLDHVMSLQYMTTLQEPSRVGVYGIGYHVPLYALGDSMDFYASSSRVDAGTVTAGIFDLAVSGKGSMYGARYNQYLPTVGNYESKVIYGLDLKKYKISMQLLGLELGADITARPVSVGYQGDWAFASGSASFFTTLVHNISGGANGRQQDFDRVRFDAKADYTAVRLGASLMQVLPSDWLARAIINGQYTRDALIPGEQYGAGGAASVRGFLEREVSNDSGITGNFEIYTAPFCGNSGWQCRALAFYDHAYLTRNHALPGEFTTIAISSVGLGLRVQLRNDMDLQVDVGHVLHAKGTTTRDGDHRMHVRLAMSF
jgi:hemolysin activation/secretion protein